MTDHQPTDEMVCAAVRTAALVALLVVGYDPWQDARYSDPCDGWPFADWWEPMTVHWKPISTSAGMFVTRDTLGGRRIRHVTLSRHPLSELTAPRP